MNTKQRITKSLTLGKMLGVGFAYAIIRGGGDWLPNLLMDKW